MGYSRWVGVVVGSESNRAPETIEFDFSSASRLPELLRKVVRSTPRLFLGPLTVRFAKFVDFRTKNHDFESNYSSEMQTAIFLVRHDHQS